MPVSGAVEEPPEEGAGVEAGFGAAVLAGAVPVSEDSGFASAVLLFPESDASDFAVSSGRFAMESLILPICDWFAAIAFCALVFS